MSVKAKSDQLKKAVGLMKEYTRQEIHSILRQRNSALPTASDSITKYCDYETYGSEISPETLNLFIEAINDQLEEEYLMEFDSIEKSYKTKSLRFEIEMSHELKIRISHLSGTWIGYSWNKTESIKVKKKGPHIYNFYKLKIFKDSALVSISTEHGHLYGRIHLIGTERIFIEAIHMARRLFIVCPLGGASSFKKLNWISATYVDSGTSSALCGITIIKRVTEKYAMIQPSKNTKEALHLEEDVAKYLLFTQHRARTAEDFQSFQEEKLKAKNQF